MNNVWTDCWPTTALYKCTFGQYIYAYRQLCWERGNIHCVRPLGRMHTILVDNVVGSIAHSWCNNNLFMSIFSTQNTSVFFKNARPTPRLVVSPEEAATSKGGNHPWRLTRQPKQSRTTVYELFRAQYLITVPTNIRSIQSDIYDRYTCMRNGRYEKWSELCGVFWWWMRSTLLCGLLCRN